MRVIGIDPGLRRTGWGVIDVDGRRLRHIANGCCASDESLSLAERLAQLFDQLDRVLELHAPTDAAVELTFVNRDAAGALRLGQARGMALLAPARRGMPVAEYAPTAIKKAVTGVGRAEKGQVQHMMGRLLPGAVIDGPDAADALAIAICHAYHAETASRMRLVATAARGV